MFQRRLSVMAVSVAAALCAGGAGTPDEPSTPVQRMLEARKNIGAMKLAGDFAGAAAAARETAREGEAAGPRGEVLRRWAMEAAIDLDAIAALNDSARGQVVRCEQMRRSIMELYIAGKHQQAAANQRDQLRLRMEVLPADHLDIAAAKGNAAYLSVCCGDLAGIDEHFRESLRIYKDRLGVESVDYATSLQNYAWGLHERGDLAQALRLSQDAVVLQAHLFGEGSNEWAASLNTVSSCQFQLRHFDDAASGFAKAMKHVKAEGRDPGLQAKLGSNLATCLTELGRYDEADERLRQLLTDRKDDPSGLAWTRLAVADLRLRQGRLKDGLEAAHAALKSFESEIGEHHPDTAAARAFVGSVTLDLGNTDSARVMLERAFRSMDAARRGGEILSSAFLADRLDAAGVAATLAWLAIDRGDAPNAIEFSERGVSTSLLRLVSGDSTLLTSEARSALQSLKEQGESYERDLEQAAEGDEGRAAGNGGPQQLHERWKEIRHQRSEMLSSEVKAGRALSATEALATLRDGEVLIYFIWNPRGVAAVVSGPNAAPVVHRLAANPAEVAELQREIEEFRSWIAEAPGPAWTRSDAAAVELRRVQMTRSVALTGKLLPTAVQELLAKAKGIVYIPSGPLVAVPLESLVLAVSDDANPPTPTYGLDRWAPVVQSPSLSVLAAARTPRIHANVQTRRAVVLSDPLFPKPFADAELSLPTPYELSELERLSIFGGPMARLPFTAREADLILTQLRPNVDAVDLRRDDATLERLEAEVSNAAIVHLATHGLSGSRWRPGDGGLVLAQPASGNGSAFLTTDRLLRTWNARLGRCDLVFLSACDTGRSFTSGETNWGLPWAFIAVGARSVVASRWRLDDEAAGGTAAAFYQAWLAGADKAAALLAAKVQARRSQPHPYYWASLALFGESK